MERNWLIRTTQKQILGPVSKEKVLEFLQKGALGLNDEVASGNGYWFSLKEKDLVDKYLHGDIPQGYNPISESKSVLAKRENPDKTSSLNSNPVASVIPKSVDQVKPIIQGVLPVDDDLEYPDITTVRSISAIEIKAETNIETKVELQPAPKTEVINSPQVTEEEAKIPNSEDLEFPDISAFSSPPVPVVEALAFPDQSDLSYPDLEVEQKIEQKLETIPEVKAELKIQGPEHEPVKEKQRDATIRDEDKILLHERKLKSSTIQTKSESNTTAKKKVTNSERTELPEHLIKRNDNYLMYILILLVLVILALFFYYYNTILNKPLPV